MAVADLMVSWRERIRNGNELKEKKGGELKIRVWKGEDAATVVT